MEHLNGILFLMSRPANKQHINHQAVSPICMNERSNQFYYMTLSKKQRLNMLENKIARRIFGVKKDENGKSRKLENDKIPFT